VSEHTKEPWHTGKNHNAERFIYGEDGWAVAECVQSKDKMFANARRIVACVNACAGYETEYLENLVFLGDTILNRINENVKELNLADQQCEELHREVTALKSGLYDSVLPKIMQQRDELLTGLKVAKIELEIQGCADLEPDDVGYLNYKTVINAIEKAEATS